MIRQPIIARSGSQENAHGEWICRSPEPAAAPPAARLAGARLTVLVTPAGFHYIDGL